MRKRVNLLRGLGLDLDTAGFYEVAKYVYDLDRGVWAKKNLATAINHYWRFRGFDYKPLKVPRLRGDRDLWIPSSEEKERLLNVTLRTRYSTKRARLIMRVLFEAGLRASELCNLKISDVRKKKKSGKVVYYLRVLGKGNKERSVPISKGLYHALVEYYSYYGRDPCIFGFSPVYLRKIIAEVKKAAGVPNFHAHAARHYRAVELLKEGVSLEALRRFLGHSRLDTTQIYLRGSDDVLETELMKKDRYFRSQEVVESEE